MAAIVGLNLADTFHRRVAATPQKTALLRKRHGVWTSLSWSDVEARVFAIAKGLREAGVGHGDRVAILSQTRPEWAFADLAILSLGALTVPIYPSVTADDVHHILSDSGARLAFIEGPLQYGKVVSLRERLPGLERLVAFESAEGAEPLSKWLPENGAPPPAAELEAWRAQGRAIKAEDTATIVYTSGTTGIPRGVILTHANFLSLIANISSELEVGERDTTLLFLPVAHILGRIEQLLSAGIGWTNAYAENLNTLMDNLAEIKPTLLVGVPRIFEKVHAAILARLDAGPVSQRLMGAWALSVGLEYSRARRAKGAGALLRVKYEGAERIFFSKIRERFGGRLRFAISGGAPLSVEVAEFFHSAGVLILEGYGLTETTGPVCVNRPKAFRFGSVGQPLPGVELRLADDGEILLKGGEVFRRYHNEARDAVNAEGFFASGDVGIIDKQGFLSITDRKKDLLITSGGKNISPQKIENLLRADPLFSQVLVVGDRHKFLGALLTLNLDQARHLAREVGSTARAPEELVADTKFFEAVRRRVEAVNATLASYERIKRFKILPRDFSVEAGELTPSQKVKRKFVTAKFRDAIEEIFQS